MTDFRNTRGLSEIDKLELEGAKFVGRRKIIMELAAIHSLLSGTEWSPILTIEFCYRLQARGRELRDALMGDMYPLPAVHESDRAEYDRLTGQPQQPQDDPPVPE